MVLCKVVGTIIVWFEAVEVVVHGKKDWKDVQEIGDYIHSFQSLLVIEPKSVTYPIDFSFINSFLRLLLGFR